MDRQSLATGGADGPAEKPRGDEARKQHSRKPECFHQRTESVHRDEHGGRELDDGGPHAATSPKSRASSIVG